MKTIHINIAYILIGFIITTACTTFDEIPVTDKPYVDRTEVLLYIGEHAGDRNTIQLNSSLAGGTPTWISEDPTVATVDQTGLVKALSVGFTPIIVTSKDDKATIDLTVKEYIPLTGFTLSAKEVKGEWFEETRVFATPIPSDASEPNLIEWTTSNEEVARVFSNGVIRTLAPGRATVTAKVGSFEEKIEVLAYTKMSKANWSIPGYDPNSHDGQIGYSSQATNEGANNKITAIIDNDLGTYWHARYASPATNYPHWFIIDLGEEVTLAQISMARRKNDGRGQTGFQLFACTEENAINPEDPTVWTWDDCGEFSFNPKIDGDQKYFLSNLPKARYIKIFIDNKYRGENNFAMVADVSAYITED